MFVKLYIFCTNILLMSADICIRTMHRKTYDLNLLGKSSFNGEGTGYLRNMIIDEKYNRLIVGSRDVIYFLNATSLQISSKHEWSSQKDYNKCIQSTTTNNNKNRCGNYIQFISIYNNNKLLICGTNSLTPKVKIISLNNTETTLSEKENFDGCASPYPDYKMVGSLTNLGEVIAGMYTDNTENKSEIVGSYIMQKPLVYRPSLKTSSKDNFKNPTFISSIYVNESVYIFFMEDSVELNNVRVATVARFCQTDNGGPRFIEQKMWVTFRKARLKCTVRNGGDEFVYKYLASMTYDETNQLFYGAFSMSRSDAISSAICTFTRQSVEDSFNSDFLSKDSSTGEWKKKSNGQFLNGCRVNRDKLTSDTPSKTAIGKEPTNSLGIQSITTALLERLMSQTIQSDQTLTHFSMAGTRFSKVTSEVVTTQSSNIIVLYVATETGSIIVTYMLPNQNEVCQVEEIVTNLKKIQNILLNKQQRILYISSDEEVIAVNVDSCGRYISMQKCLDAHSPLCGWSDMKKRCISTSKLHNSNETLKQDLTKCAQRKDFWNTWSPWKPCTAEDNANYCLCRQRECQSCDKSQCGDGETMQIKNCTETAIVNYQQWVLSGSIDGSWSKWGNWSNCNLGKCGNETMTRYRTCTSPEPNGGNNCEGDSFQCKSCAKKTELCMLHWSVWSSWGDCYIESLGIYKRSRTRVCSQQSGCLGDSIEYMVCGPTGTIIWGEWSVCSCIRVRHRMPVFIAGCKENCKQLRVAQYEAHCTPDEELNCPTTTPLPTTTTTTATATTTRKRTTTLPTTSETITTKISTISENTTDNNIDDHISKYQPTPHPNESLKAAKNGIQLKLRDIVIVVCGILLTCFLVCTCIIVIILKRKKGKFDIPMKLDMQSPQLIRNKSIGNDLDLIDTDYHDYHDDLSNGDLKLTQLALPEIDAPLMKHSTKV